MGRSDVAFCALFMLSAASASAADFPARKAGLWEITIAGAHSMKVQQCADPASDEAMMQDGIGFLGGCARHDVQDSGGTITVITACKSAGKTMISRMVITGSLDSKYTMTVTSQGQGMTVGGSPLTMHAEWLGPCGRDEKPGDVIFPDGTKINILRPSKGTVRSGVGARRTDRD
jgi:hypothetical protein